MEINAPHESISNCLHEYIGSEGSCSACGLSCSLYTPRTREPTGDKASLHFNKNNDRSIIPDLAKYNFPEDIKHHANDLFRKIGLPTKRSHERNKMLFYLIYTAYREKGQFISPQTLGKQMNLTQGDINRSLNQYSEVNTKYRPKICRATPIDALPELCSSLDLEHLIEDVKELGREILSKSPNLAEEFPHKVAAGILSYFMEFNGIKISNETFKRRVDFSDVTIKDIHQRIAKVHNS